MQSVSNGYTIVEVIIFLAISGALLISSMAFLSGNEGHNRFSQSMRDTQSKIQDLLNDIPTGNAGGTGGITGQAHCFSSPGKLQIDSGPANPANPNETNGDCIFLGKALQFTDDSTPPVVGQIANQESQIFVYSVFGSRQYTDPITNDVRPVANLVEANPFAAVGTGSCGSCSGTADLTEQYSITGGAKVKKIIKSSGVAGENSHLAGFYLSFNQLLATSSGSASLRAFQYRLPGNYAPGNSSTGNAYKNVDDCIGLTYGAAVSCFNPPAITIPSPSTWPEPLTDWEICFGNDSNSDMALITIKSSGGLNATTKLEFTQC